MVNVWKGGKQLGVWVLEGGDCAYPCVWLRTAYPCVSSEHICVCYSILMSLSFLSLFVCVSNAFVVCLCIFTLACNSYIHIRSRTLVIEWSCPHLTLSFWVKIEGISSLLTQLVMPSGGITHRPVPSPSKQGSSRSPSVHTNDREQGKQWDNILVEVVEWGCFTYDLLLFHYKHELSIAIIEIEGRFRQVFFVPYAPTFLRAVSEEEKRGFMFSDGLYVHRVLVNVIP